MARNNAIPANCDAEIFKDGLGICFFDAPPTVAEEWVQSVAKASGQRVDWHYSGGLVNVLYLGDYDRVRAAVEELKGSLVVDGKPVNVCGLPPGAHGLYRKGDALPDDCIGVSNT